MSSSPRKAHVKRIYAKDTNDDDILDIYVDIARIDEALVNNGPLTYNGSPEFAALSWPFGDADKQGSKLHVQWQDDKKEDNNKARKTKKRKIRNPQDDTSGKTDGSPAIELDIIKKTWFNTKVRDKNETLGHVWNLNNNPKDPNSPDNDGDVPNKRRKVKPVRVVHNDLDGLDMTKPVKWTDYLTALKKGMVDDSQYVDAEVMQKFTVSQRNGDQTQDAQVTLNNDEVIKQFKASPSDAYLVRLDPFQTIVNVQWLTPSCVVISHWGQVFYASKHDKWKEFDVPPPPTGSVKGIVLDVNVHKFFFSYLYPGGVGFLDKTVLYSISSGLTGEWKIAVTFDRAYVPFDIEYFIPSKLLVAFGSGDPIDGPWSINGGKTWNTGSPSSSLTTGLTYPAPIWDNLHSSPRQKYYIQNVGAGAGGTAADLCDINNVKKHTVVGPPITGSGGVVQTYSLTAGNGKLVGIFLRNPTYITDGDDPDLVLAVSSDNSTWTTTSIVGDIEGFSGSPGNKYTNPLTAPVAQDGYQSFFGCKVDFVPGWNLFVFVGSKVDTFHYPLWVSSVPTDDSATPMLSSNPQLFPLPLEIYTSPDGVTWTKQFQATYTNGSHEPVPITAPEPTYLQFWEMVASGGAPKISYFDDGSILNAGVYSIAPGDDNNATFQIAQGQTSSAEWEAFAAHVVNDLGGAVSGGPPSSAVITLPEFEDALTYNPVLFLTNWLYAGGFTGGFDAPDMTVSKTATSGWSYPTKPAT